MSALSPHSSLSDLLKASQQVTANNNSSNNNNGEESNHHCDHDNPNNNSDSNNYSLKRNNQQPGKGKNLTVVAVPTDCTHGVTTAANNTNTTENAAAAAVARIVNSPNRPSHKMYRRRTTGDVTQEERNAVYLQQCASGPMTGHYYLYETTNGRPATSPSFDTINSSRDPSLPLQHSQPFSVQSPQPQQHSSSHAGNSTTTTGSTGIGTGLSQTTSWDNNKESWMGNRSTTMNTTIQDGMPAPLHNQSTVYPFAQYDPLYNHVNNSNNNNKDLLDSVAENDPSNMSVRKGHRPSMTLDTASLADIAAQLATLKPQQPQNNQQNNQQKQQQQQQQLEEFASLQKSSNHLITLGMDPSESTGTKKSHRRFKSQPFGRKSMSMLDSSMLSLELSNENNIPMDNHSNHHHNNIDDDDNHEADKKKREEKDVPLGHRRSFSAGLAAVFRRDDDGDKDRPRSVTPVGFRSKEKKSGSGSQKKGKDRDDDVVRPTTPVDKVKISSKGGGQENAVGVVHGNVSVTASVEDFSPQKLEITLRSSEQDPSPHQVSIPSAHEMLFPARLCEALMQYRIIDQNFDYSSLVGMPRAQMNNFLLMIESSSPSRNKASTDSFRPSSPVVKQSSTTSKGASITGHRLMEVHGPIIEFLAKADDLILEGFFHEICDHTKRKSFDTTSDMSTLDRMEVAIFKSDARRQFFVIYQGCSETQEKPIKKSEQKDGVERRFTLGRKDDDRRFSEEQPVVVFPPFRKAYFNSEIEKQVFTLLDSLAEQNPFFDVIITGHSFGGVMALLSSMRYANIRPAIMVSCYAFGCPKIGNIDFRYYVNSLPNLRVFRLEYGCDPWTNVPDHPTWCHAGHTITICKHTDNSVGNTNMDDPDELLVKAYKFGEHRPEYTGKESKLGKILSRQGNKDKQMDHDISSYIVSLEQIIGYGKGPIGLWPTEFVGEDGTGVRGLDKEKRLVC